MDDYLFRTMFARRHVELTAEAEHERLARAVSAGRPSVFERLLARLRRNRRTSAMILGEQDPARERPGGDQREVSRIAASHERDTVAEKNRVHL